jgi:hypothetical protein
VALLDLLNGDGKSAPTFEVLLNPDARASHVDAVVARLENYTNDPLPSAADGPSASTAGALASTADRRTHALSANVRVTLVSVAVASRIVDRADLAADPVPAKKTLSSAVVAAIASAATLLVALLAFCCWLHVYSTRYGHDPDLHTSSTTPAPLGYTIRKPALVAGQGFFGDAAPRDSSGVAANSNQGYGAGDSGGYGGEAEGYGTNQHHGALSDRGFNGESPYDYGDDGEDDGEDDGFDFAVGGARISNVGGRADYGPPAPFPAAFPEDGNPRRPSSESLGLPPPPWQPPPSFDPPASTQAKVHAKAQATVHAKAQAKARADAQAEAAATAATVELPPAPAPPTHWNESLPAPPPPPSSAADAGEVNRVFMKGQGAGEGAMRHPATDDDRHPELGAVRSATARQGGGGGGVRGRFAGTDGGTNGGVVYAQVGARTHLTPSFPVSCLI